MPTYYKGRGYRHSQQNARAARDVCRLTHSRASLRLFTMTNNDAEGHLWYNKMERSHNDETPLLPDAVHCSVEQIVISFARKPLLLQAFSFIHKVLYVDDTATIAEQYNSLLSFDSEMNFTGSTHCWH